MSSSSSHNNYLQAAEIQKLYTPRVVNSEKRDFGHVLIMGGSYGMMGSVTMASRAALRSGAGLLSILAPNCGINILQQIVPEAMVLETPDERHLEYLPGITHFTTLAVGPGIGKDIATIHFIDTLLHLNRPMELDADALNIIAGQHWQSRIPKGSVITPHHREFARLFGEQASTKEVLDVQQQKARELGICIVLKGAHTCIVFPDGQTYYNSTGNPGMAKGGSGDVLTGIITGLWSRF